MPNIEHNTLSGSDLHEPKGIAAASDGDVYVADGSGSGAWTSKYNLGQLALKTTIEDISSAAAGKYIPIPYAGTITKVTTVLVTAINTADATLDVTNAAGNSMGTITIAHTGSAGGDVDTLVPSTNNIVTADSFIRIASDGGSTGSASVEVTVILERS